MKAVKWPGVLAIVLGMSTASGQPAPQAPAVSGEELSERLLAAMGGRNAWANVTFVHVEALHDDLDIPEPFVNRIWNDFSRPRVRFWAGNGAFTRHRWIDDGAGVRETTPSARTPMSREEYESDRAWWEANVYRTLQRIARRDSSMTPRAVGTTRLEIIRPDGRVLNWFVLNQKGEPMLFGTGGDARGTAFGPLAVSGALRYPKWGARADGSWRYEIVRFIASNTVPVEAFGER